MGRDNRSVDSDEEMSQNTPMSSGDPPIHSTDDEIQHQRNGGSGHRRRSSRSKDRENNDYDDDETVLRSLSTMDTHTFRRLRDHRRGTTDRKGKGGKGSDTERNGSSSRRRHRGGDHSTLDSSQVSGISRHSRQSGTTVSSGSVTPLNGNLRSSRSHRRGGGGSRRRIPWQAMVIFGLGCVTMVKLGFVELKLEKSTVDLGRLGEAVDRHNYLRGGIAGITGIGRTLETHEEYFEEPNIGDSKDWGSEAGRDALDAFDELDGKKDSGGVEYSKAILTEGINKDYQVGYQLGHNQQSGLGLGSAPLANTGVAPLEGYGGDGNQGYGAAPPLPPPEGGMVQEGDRGVVGYGNSGIQGYNAAALPADGGQLQGSAGYGGGYGGVGNGAPLLPPQPEGQPVQEGGYGVGAYGVGNQEGYGAAAPLLPPQQQGQPVQEGAYGVGGYGDGNQGGYGAAAPLLPPQQGGQPVQEGGYGVGGYGVGNQEGYGAAALPPPSQPEGQLVQEGGYGGGGYGDGNQGGYGAAAQPAQLPADVNSATALGQYLPQGPAKTVPGVDAAQWETDGGGAFEQQQAQQQQQDAFVHLGGQLQQSSEQQASLVGAEQLANGIDSAALLIQQGDQQQQPSDQNFNTNADHQEQQSSIGQQNLQANNIDIQNSGSINNDPLTNMKQNLGEEDFDQLLLRLQQQKQQQQQGQLDVGQQVQQASAGDQLDAGIEGLGVTPYQAASPQQPASIGANIVDNDYLSESVVANINDGGDDNLQNTVPNTDEDYKMLRKEIRNNLNEQRQHLSQLHQLEQLEQQGENQPLDNQQQDLIAGMLPNLEAGGVIADQQIAGISSNLEAGGVIADQQSQLSPVDGESQSLVGGSVTDSIDEDGNVIIDENALQNGVGAVVDGDDPQTGAEFDGSVAGGEEPAEDNAVREETGADPSSDSLPLTPDESHDSLPLIPGESLNGNPVHSDSHDSLNQATDKGDNEQLEDDSSQQEQQDVTIDDNMQTNDVDEGEPNTESVRRQRARGRGRKKDIADGDGSDDEADTIIEQQSEQTDSTENAIVSELQDPTPAQDDLPREQSGGNLPEQSESNVEKTAESESEGDLPQEQSQQTDVDGASEVQEDPTPAQNDQLPERSVEDGIANDNPLLWGAK